MSVKLKAYLRGTGSITVHRWAGQEYPLWTRIGRGIYNAVQLGAARLVDSAGRPWKTEMRGRYCYARVDHALAQALARAELVKEGRLPRPAGRPEGPTWGPAGGQEGEPMAADRQMKPGEAKLVNQLKNDLETIESLLEQGKREIALAGIEGALHTMGLLRETVRDWRDKS